ncbi:MAG: hypothetical protein ACXIU8_06150 [Alkalilacustris sp.]
MTDPDRPAPTDGPDRGPPHGPGHAPAPDAAALARAFDALRARTAPPSDALMARVMADAAAARLAPSVDLPAPAAPPQDRPTPAAPPASSTPRPNAPPRRRTEDRARGRPSGGPARPAPRWRAGGARLAPAGLVAALAAGFVLGMVAPAAVLDPLAAVQTAVFGPPLLLEYADAADLLTD